jgi:MFS family permease
MSPLAVLLAVRAGTDSFGAAGVAAGAFAACNAASAPVLGRMVDRMGQRPVLLGAAAGQGLALVVVSALASRGGAIPLLVLASAASGALVPPTSACARALWREVAQTPRQRESAYALEAISQEVAFTTGPILVAACAALASPNSALLVAAALSVVGNGVFASSRLAATRPGPRPHEAHDRRFPAQRRLRAVLASVAFVGVAFGGIQVGITALAVDLRADHAAGVLLGACGLGSFVGGVFYGGRAWRGSLDRRYVALLLLGAIAAVPLLLASALTPALAASTLAGIAYAPALSCHYALVELFAPRLAITEAFTWSNSALISGMAVGTAMAGWLVDASSKDAAFVLITMSMLCAAAVGGMHRIAPGPVLDVQR